MERRKASKAKVLYASAELHDAIKAVLGSPTRGERRVALVAYVGQRAEAFLPHPKGLEIVCALEPGATSAEAIIRLRERGATVSQAERLHMKVYWSSRRGAIVCSANASAAALGRAGLKEAGVWIPRGGVDIRRMLRYVRPHGIRDADLRSLARDSDRIASTRPRRQPRGERQTPSLREWLSTPARKPWKLGWWDHRGATAKAVKAEALARYGVRDPAQHIDCARNHCRSGDWVLQFNADGGRSASWMYVDFVMRVASSDKRAYSRDYPYQAVQVNTTRHYPSPPFYLDSEARAAIASAVDEFGADRLQRLKTATVPMALKTLLRKHVPRSGA